MHLSSFTHNRPYVPLLKSALLRVPLCLLASIIVTSWLPYSISIVSAADLCWSSVKIPSGGVEGRWVLAAGSDMQLLTQADDGTLYCYANPTGTPFRLFKSTDGGRAWSYTGQVVHEIVDIAIVPGTADNVCYATTSRVYRLNNDETGFIPLPEGPGGAGLNGVEITSIDVSQAGGLLHVLVGTRGAGSGGVFIWQENSPSIWQDTGIGDYDVCCAAFSPGFASDRQMTAAVTDGTDTIIRCGVLGEGWGLNAGDARIPETASLSASIAFPTDFNSDLTMNGYTQFISLDTGSGGGGVYRLRGQAAPAESAVTDLNVSDAGIDIAGLAVAGSADRAVILAGAAGDNRTFFSEDAGLTWSSAVRTPTGDSKVYTAISPDYVNNQQLYAATSGEESAFSISSDKGCTWDQVGMIDSRVTEVLDLGISPGGDQETELFLVTAGIQTSLWRGEGERWERVFCSSPDGDNRIDRVLLSPGYAQNHRVYLAHTGHPFIWYSIDNGQLFHKVDSVDQQNGSPVNIDAWAVASGDTLGIGSFNGEDSMIYITAPGGLGYIHRADAGKDRIHSVAFSPDHAADGTILAGSAGGRVYYSTNNGLVFEPLRDPSSQEPPFAGCVSVAFDSDYKHNRTVYAAGESPGEGVHRFVMLGESFCWEPLNSSLPAGTVTGKIAATASGTLYTVNTDIAGAVTRKSSVARSLDPTATVPAFDMLTAGLEDDIVLSGLWAQGNLLWTVDTTHDRLLTCRDTLVFPAVPVNPPDNASGLNPKNISLSWQPMEGATAYCWQVDTDDQFTDIPSHLEGTSVSPSVSLPNLSVDINYYWRVRAISPAVSPWSAVQSFNTRLIEAPGLMQPAFNSTIAVSPVFRWSTCDGAEKYEMHLSTTSNFSNNPTIIVAETNFWECSFSLEPGGRYYWKVRAVNNGNMSEWSEVYLFTVKEPPPSSGPGSSSGSSRESDPSPTPGLPSDPLYSTEPSPTSSPIPSPETVSGPDNENLPGTNIRAEGSPEAVPTSHAHTPDKSALSQTPQPDQTADGEPNEFWQFMSLGLGTAIVMMGAVIVHLRRKNRAE